MQGLLLLNFIVPFVMILVGYLFMKHPVWDMESHNGYNTPTSRKSQAHWDYAQSIAPGIFISLGKKLGVMEIALSGILVLLPISIWVVVSVGNCVGAGVLIYGFCKTDSEIRKKFSEGCSSFFEWRIQDK